jgi:hypothetical protein
MNTIRKRSDALISKSSPFGIHYNASQGEHKERRHSNSIVNHLLSMTFHLWSAYLSSDITSWEQLDITDASNIHSS